MDSFENSEKSKILKPMNIEKMAVKEKELHFIIIQMNFQKSHKYLKNLAELCKPTNILKEFCQVFFLMKTKKQHIF